MVENHYNGLAKLSCRKYSIHFNNYNIMGNNKHHVRELKPSISKRILYLQEKIEKLEKRYLDVCEHSGEWSMAAEKIDKKILILNKELSNLIRKR